MTTNYKTYADQVRTMNALFAKTIKEKGDSLNQLMADWRWSPKGKEEKKQVIFSELKESCKNMSKLFREIVDKFCKDFEITFPEDNKDHSVDIQNALRVVDMLDSSLDTVNLKNILQPLSGSYRSTKTVLDVIRVKADSKTRSLGGVDQYSNEVLIMIEEKSGVYTNVVDYLNYFDRIKDILTNAANYDFYASSVNDSPVIYMQDRIPYSFLSCEEWMIQVGKMYSVLENQFSSLFQNHVISDRELIETILK